MSVRMILCAALLGSIASPVVAGDDDMIAIKVSVSDLDLTQAHDRNVMQKRINSAARKLCDSGIKGASARAFETECIRLALQQTGGQVDRAVAAAHNKQAPLTAITFRAGQTPAG